MKKLSTIWTDQVEAAATAAGLPAPKLVNLESPFRRVSVPLSEYLKQLEPQFPDRQIAVIIPELVETTWWDWLLHNHRATALKAALLLLGNQDVIVVNVPWFLGPQGKAAKRLSRSA